MAKGEDSSSVAQQTKKKQSEEDETMLDDVAAKPLQLQRRRVWRACESCRYVIHTFPQSYRRSPTVTSVATFLSCQTKED
jgi:hypothetical protein